MKVIVVTNTELGWDNVVGVFDVGLLEQVEALFTGRCYVIREESIAVNLDDFE